MRHETAFSNAMKKAGVDTDSAMLYSIAQDVLRRHGVDARAALDEFTEELSDAGGLWSALLLRDEKRAAGLRYLNSVARDMRGKFDEAAAQATIDSRASGGHVSLKRSAAAKSIDGMNEAIAVARGEAETARVTTVSPKGDGAAQAIGGGDSRPDGGRSDNPRESGAGEPKDLLKAGAPVALPKNASDGAAQGTHASQNAIGRPSFAPAKTTRFDRLKAVKEALPPSIFDTMILRDGTALGDLRWSQLDRFIASNAREAELLRLVKNHAVPSDPNAKVRDVVKMDAMQRMMQKAAEIVDA